jgi:uncharacterized delta-60 repeat protein
MANQLSELALARYSANGTLDASFGSGGVVTSTLLWSGYDIALTGAGKLVVTGTHRSGPDVDRASVAQFSSTGTLDTTFGQSGLTVTGMENGSKLVLDSGGRIVVAGYVFNPAGANPGGTGGLDFAVTCLNPDGSPDTGFGTGGMTQLDSPGTDERFYGVALQADGKIVACGAAGGLFTVARFLGDAPAFAAAGGTTLTSLATPSATTGTGFSADAPTALLSHGSRGVADQEDAYELRAADAFFALLAAEKEAVLFGWS